MRLLKARERFTPWFELDELPEAMGKLFRREGADLVPEDPAELGVFAVRGQLAVVVPRFMSLESPHAHLSKVRAIIQALARYYRQKAQKAVAERKLKLGVAWTAGVESLLDQIDAAFLIAEDFREHGSVVVSAPVTSNREQPGRVHWPRTLARAPLVMNGPNVIYANPWVTRQRILADHPLTRLHRQTASACGEMLGIRLDVSPDEPVRSAAAALATLEAVRHELFQDRHRYIHGLLRRFYLSQTAGGGASEKATGLWTTTFSMVWEAIVKKALGAHKKVKIGGRYHHGDQESIRGAVLKPDLVTWSRWRKKRVVLIIDAKDYDPQGADGWPRTDSLAKQMLYRHLLPMKIPSERIGNAFVFPADLDSRMVRLKAVHSLDGAKERLRSFGRVVCLDLDFCHAVCCYVRGSAETLKSVVTDLVMEQMDIAIGKDDTWKGSLG